MNMTLEKKNDEKSRLMASKNSFKDALIEKWAFKVLTFLALQKSNFNNLVKVVIEIKKNFIYRFSIFPYSSIATHTDNM